MDAKTHLRERWVEEVVEYKGSIVRAFKRVTPPIVYACPICGKNVHTPKFVSVKDLMFHLKAHAIGALERRKEPPRRRFR